MLKVINQSKSFNYSLYTLQKLIAIGFTLYFTVIYICKNLYFSYCQIYVTWSKKMVMAFGKKNFLHNLLFTFWHIQCTNEGNNKTCCLFLVGLLLGASALTLCELIDFLVTLSVARMCKREKSSTNHVNEGPQLWPLLWNLRYETFDTLYITVGWPVAQSKDNHINAIKITEKLCLHLQIP